jgi:p-cumate 2,3-dioxygenase beta subunit
VISELREHARAGFEEAFTLTTHTTAGTANRTTGPLVGITREQVEDFLFAEADLLDSWRLEEWVALFDQERGGYYMPTTDLPEGDPNAALFLISDDMPKLRSRVEQLLSGLTWAENPRSRTRHMVNNVRIVGAEGEALLVKANFVVFRMRFQNIDPYIGSYRYKLIPSNGTFKILERRVTLDLEALRPHGKVSFIV